MESDSPAAPSILRSQSAGHGEPWPQRDALDRFVRQCAARLFGECRSDPRAWLSEPDLQCLFHAILRQELAARGLSPLAVHAGYPLRLSLGRSSVEAGARTSGYAPDDAAPRVVRSHLLPVDIVLAVPDSIRPLRSRRWGGELAAVMEVKRGFERGREIRNDLARLGAIHAEWPHLLVYMLIASRRSRHELVHAVERGAVAHGVVLLYDNYWGTDSPAEQPELGVN